jgi:hypothetical protein
MDRGVLDGDSSADNQATNPPNHAAQAHTDNTEPVMSDDDNITPAVSPSSVPSPLLSPLPSPVPFPPSPSAVTPLTTPALVTTIVTPTPTADLPTPLPSPAAPSSSSLSRAPGECDGRHQLLATSIPAVSDMQPATESTTASTDANTTPHLASTTTRRITRSANKYHILGHYQAQANLTTFFQYHLSCKAPAPIKKYFTDIFGDYSNNFSTDKLCSCFLYPAHCARIIPIDDRPASFQQYCHSCFRDICIQPAGKLSLDWTPQMELEAMTFYEPMYTGAQIDQLEAYAKRVRELEDVIPVKNLKEHAQLNGWAKLTLMDLEKEIDHEVEKVLKEQEEGEEVMITEDEGWKTKKKKKKNKKKKAAK